MKQQIVITWWNNAEPKAEIPSETMEVLTHNGFKQALRMILEGYDSGELVESIAHEGMGSTEEIYYRGSWELIDGDDDAEQAVQSVSAMPEGWEALPSDLRSHLNAFRSAIAIARDAAEPANRETGEDDRGYWEHELSVLDRIEKQLTTNPKVTPWISVDESLPAIPPRHHRGPDPFLVKTASGKVGPAHLVCGRPNFETGMWIADEDGIKERHWVGMEGGLDATSRIISDAVAWMPIPK